MRRITTVVAVVVLSVLVACTPAAGAHNVMFSIHTTESDFDTATTLNNVTTSDSGSVVLQPDAGTTATRPDDNATYYDTASKWGLRIKPDTDLAGVNISVSSFTSGATTAYVTQTDGTVISSASISSGVANISAELDDGTTYYLVVDGGGSQYTPGGLNNGANYPYTSGDVDITGGVFSDTSVVTDTAYTVKTVEAWVEHGNTGTYIGSSHAAGDTGFTDLALTDASATVTWQGYDGSSWVDLASQTYTTSGNKSLALSDGYQDYRVNVTFEATGSSPSATLEDEGTSVETSPPSFDNSTASPSGGEKVSSTPTYSINGSDPDFGDGEGDTVTLSWYRNGTLLGTTTETSNGTWTFTPSTSRGGTSQWHVEASDSYHSGTQATSDTFVYTAPGTLRIENESNAGALVNNVEVELEFYFGDGSETYTRTTSDGTIDMSGLPADKPFIVVAEADGYHSRRIYVPSLYETQTVYLLPTSANSVSPTFELVDYSGDYPSEDTVLKVQRVLNGSWRTVEGDFFGATGSFPATLKYNQRHRLILVNTETGQREPLGSYTPKTSDTQEIVVYANGSINVVSGGASVQVDPGIRRLQSTSDQDVAVTLRSPGGELDSWTTTVTHVNTTSGTSTQLASNSGTSSTGGTWTTTLNLTNDTGVVWVNTTYTLTDGSTITDSVKYTITDLYRNEFGLLPILTSLGDRIPDAHQSSFLSLLAVVVTLAVLGVAANLPASSEIVGLAGIMTLAGFAVLGWIGYGPVFAAAAAGVGMAALQRGV